MTGIMDFSLSEHHELLRKTVRDFARTEVLPHAKKWDEEERFPKEIVPKLAELGLLGIRIPEEYGGSGMDVTSYAICVEEIARVDGSLALTVASHNGLGTGHILVVRQRGHKKKYLPEGGERRVARGLGAHRAGQRQRLAPASARRRAATGDNWVINGTKMFITQGSVGGFCVVLARTNPDVAKQKGITAFVVEHGTKGFTASKHLEKLGCRSSDTVELTFEEVVVGDEQRVGEVDHGFTRHDADPRSRSHLDRRDGARARLRRARDGGHATRRIASSSTSRSPSSRRSSGCSPTCKTELDAAQLLTYRAAWLADQGRPFTKEASMAKLFASEAATRACNKALQIHGGYGYTREFAVERHLRDAKICEIGEGTSEVQRMVIAKQLLRRLSAVGSAVRRRICMSASAPFGAPPETCV